MAGIYALWEPEKHHTGDVFRFFYPYGKPDILSEETDCGNLKAGRCVIDRFQNERFLREGDQLLIANEGILYDTTDAFETIKNAWKENPLSFPQHLRGQFSGFIFDKSTLELFVYTDILSTKSLYYVTGEDRAFGLASEAIALSKWWRTAGRTLTTDRESILTG